VSHGEVILGCESDWLMKKRSQFMLVFTPCIDRRRAGNFKALAD
jgi:hypothetical protein